MNGQTSTDDPNWAAVCVEPPGERRGKRLPVQDRTTTSLAADTFWAATQYLNVQVYRWTFCLKAANEPSGMADASFVALILSCNLFTELTLTVARTGAGPSP